MNNNSFRVYLFIYLFFQKYCFNLMQFFRGVTTSPFHLHSDASKRYSPVKSFVNFIFLFIYLKTIIYSVQL